MEVLVAILLGVLNRKQRLVSFLILRARTFSVVLGLTLLSHAVNCFYLVWDACTPMRPPSLAKQHSTPTPPPPPPPPPLPQALVLTAIVIGFAMDRVRCRLSSALRARAEE